MGASPEVSDKSLESDQRIIPDVDTAMSICDSIVWASQKLIFNASRITAKINGERPYSKQQLKSKGKGYKRNCSTRFLQQMCAKVTPRFYMPVKQASTLTAAKLPDGWTDGPVKSEKFRKRITETVRAWPKWDYFLEGLAREVTQFGFGFASWFDEYEWRPHLLRMDKGFVPQGTELMDEDIQFFVVKWQYHPDQLLKLLKANVDAGRSEWKKKACVEAINKSAPPPVGPTFAKWRDYEDLIRQSVWSIAYYKAMRLIDTYHLFAKEPSGTVSHYVVWKDGTKTGDDDEASDLRLLYKVEDEFNSINDICVPVPFGYGDGTLQGSWGVGQLLFDMANQVEIARNEAMDAQSNSGRLKLVVNEGKNINDVNLTVSDDMMTVCGAQLASPGAATPTNPTGFKTLDDEFTMWAMQLVGNYVPPIAIQPSDTKASAINAATQEEKEVQNNNLQNFLKHIAFIIATTTKRLCNPDSPDEVSQEVIRALLNDDQLTEEEIDLLINQPSVQTVMEFTPAAASARAQFAASRLANPQTAPLYDPRKLEEIQAAAIPYGKNLIEYALVPAADGSQDATGVYEQTIENSTLDTGQAVPILAHQKHWAHYNTLKPHVDKGLQAPNANTQALGVALNHMGGHYQAAVSTKTMPPDQVNPEKSWLAQAQKTLEERIQRAQAMQMAKQAVLPQPSFQGQPTDMTQMGQ